MNVGKKAWVVLVCICVIIVVAALVLMLVLVPQNKSTGILAGDYEQIAKQDYTFSGTEIKTLEKQYVVTESDVNKGKKTDKFDDGNINPFTPKSEVTIYNEPTLESDNKTNSGTLTPDDK